MELVDNLVICRVPGAMDAGLGSALLWGSLRCRCWWRSW